MNTHDEIRASIERHTHMADDETYKSWLMVSKPKSKDPINTKDAALTWHIFHSVLALIHTYEAELRVEVEKTQVFDSKRIESLAAYRAVKKIPQMLLDLEKKLGII